MTTSTNQIQPPAIQIGLSYGWKFTSLLSIGNSNELHLIVGISWHRKKTGEGYGSTSSFTKGPFHILTHQSPIPLVKEYLEAGEHKSARTVYNYLKIFTKKRAEKIIGDICAQVIMTELQKSQPDETIFLLDGPPYTTLLNKIASMFPSQDVTIAFLTFHPAHLLTSILSPGLPEFSFDLYELIHRSGFSKEGPFPDFSRITLSRNYFIKFGAIKGKSFVPVRIDIFCQGQTPVTIERKLAKVLALLNTNGEWFPYTLSQNTELSWNTVKMPVVIEQAHSKVKSELERIKETNYGEEPW